MLSDTLKDFDKIYSQLWVDIRSPEKKEEFIKQCISPEYISILEKLVKNKIFQLNAFEILLHVAPDNALNLLKKRYLSLDLSNNAKDHVSDLEIMFSDIKEILGEDKLKEILNCTDFSPENKNNQRVIDAIDFAMDND
ncbi:hypothetical protein ACY4DU_004182 [Salmonella enterica]|uniref:hypothetical protein n=1 Tax=Salmonella enterica TaxID=28901 RepID=UPI001CE3B74A|nr:hypothetical protein [Salmonella enterica]MDJ8268456.1 hypothetical protein [Salmonella enterica]WFQ16447.1 hypothetical protein P1839_19490 [Salmonella enterica subsp. enterica]